MNPIKITPSAFIDIEVFDANNEQVALATTRNALKINFIQSVGKGLFSPRFSLRLGHASASSDYTDCQLLSQAIPTGSWPVATADSEWPSAVVNNGYIEWSTIQKFNVPAGLVVGVINELGFNFYGNSSDEIHARGTLAEPLAVDETNSLKISYRLTFVAPFVESTYYVDSYYGSNVVSHEVQQRWSKRSTLWDIIGTVPTNQECSLYNGLPEAIDIEPTEPIGTSSHAYVSMPSPTGFTVTAVIDSDNGNTLQGLRTLSWATIPVKMMFTPPIPKSSESVMTISLTWELEV